MVPQRWPLVQSIAVVHAFSGDTNLALNEVASLLEVQRHIADFSKSSLLSTLARPGKVITNLTMAANLLSERDDMVSLQRARAYAEQARLIERSDNDFVGTMLADLILANVNRDLHNINQSEANALEALKYAELIKETSLLGPGETQSGENPSFTAAASGGADAAG